ncbi:MAG: excalibur calcium-binding domain-containing protein [Sulfuriferula sp.]|nr:excalibur calcium-binding domain-containing protein [Sulfuriferula sp.]
MIKLFLLALAVTQLLFTSGTASATQFFKCNINGATLYQQEPCQSGEVRKPPTVKELNAQRQKELAQEKEHPSTSKSSSHFNTSSAVRNSEMVKPISLPQSSFRCDGRQHCGQMTSCAEAQYFLSNCPNVKMDGDRDNIPCEEQWCY